VSALEERCVEQERENESYYRNKSLERDQLYGVWCIYCIVSISDSMTEPPVPPPALVEDKLD
jgi:hypothetical protein